MQHLSLYARIISRKASSENIHNVCESSVGIHNIVNAWFAVDVHCRCAVDTCDLHCYCDTSLLLFLKSHIDKPVSSDWMF